MPPSAPHDLTVLLQAWSRGDVQARERVMQLVYAELRRRAAAYLRHERRGHSLQPTALVNEAYLRLAGQEAFWRDRGHFLAMASQMMRRILVDHARARGRRKRAAGLRVELAEGAAATTHREVELVALDAALDELAAMDPRQARVVELQYFGGLSNEETAEVLEISPATVKRDWVAARAWLFRRPSGGGSEPASEG